MEKKLIPIDEFQQHLVFLSQVFDFIRMVDPMKKKVITFFDNQKYESSFSCSDFWNQNKICDNCIALQCITEKEMFFKLQSNSSGIYLACALPLQQGDNILAAELFKDVTESLKADDNNPEDSLLDIIHTLNNLHIIDNLTSIYNRYFITERLPTDIMRCTMENKPISIILADIDFFKKVNDTHGHLAGDQVLKAFSELLAEQAGEAQGWAARYGGEEFLVCLSGMDGDATVALAESMRMKTEALCIFYKDIPIQITSSFGVLTVQHPQEYTSEALIEKVDQLLYQAKNSGRNRVASDIL